MKAFINIKDDLDNELESSTVTFYFTSREDFEDKVAHWLNFLEEMGLPEFEEEEDLE